MFNQPIYNNPYQQQLQNLQQQRLNQYEQTQQQPINKVIPVQSEDVAKNTQIALDGSTTYFVFGDTILTRTWNVALGSIENKTFKLQNNINTPKQEKDRLKSIEDTLQEILKKVTPATNKKVVKDE